MVSRRVLVMNAVALAYAGIGDTFAQGNSKLWRVGFLSASGRPASIESDRFGGFPRGMQELGYVEGKNLEIVWRFGDGSGDRTLALAHELVAMKVDVIVTAGVPPTSAAKQATASIPIVMGTATDPLGSGLIVSLARPGGNITGLSNVAVDLGSKHLELLIDIVPRVARVAVLMDPDTSTHPSILRSIQAAARRANVTILPVEAQNARAIDEAFAIMARDGAGALIIPISPLFNQQRRQMAELANKYKIPAVSGLTEYAEVGGLIGYGQNLTEHYRRAATYVDKIFKGAKPADLPVEQPTRFELLVNRSTAQSLGLALSQSLLIRADRIVD